MHSRCAGLLAGQVMSEVSLELSGGQPQQLDSLRTNVPWTGDTGRLRDIDLCTPTGEMPVS